MSEAAPRNGSTSGPATRIGIQSTDRLRRESLAAYLDTKPTFTIVGRVARHEDAVALCGLERPDVMLLDAGTEATQVIATCAALRSRFPDTRVLLTYERLSATEIAAAQAAGVAAVTPTAHGLAAMVDVLRKVSAGPPMSLPQGNGLSDRQREILLLMASGHSAIEIAELLRISPGTVENHKRRLYAKLNATSAVHAIARAATFGIIDDLLAGQAPPSVAAGPVEGADDVHADPPPEDGRTTLVFATGTDHAVVDRVVQTLIEHRFPVFREHSADAPRYGHWWRWHRGPVVRVLVDPTPEDWVVGTSFGRSAVVVRSGPVDRAAITAALARGASAVVPADHITDHLVPVLNLVAMGYLVLDQACPVTVGGTAHGRFATRPPQPPALTSREHDILRSIGRSYSVRQTAMRLGIAVKTVENTQGHLFRKLGVHNRAEALASAYSLGLLQPEGGGRAR